MSITVIDYGSGNLKSAAKALETAANNINTSSKVVVTSDPKIIKQSENIFIKIPIVKFLSHTVTHSLSQKKTSIEF